MKLRFENKRKRNHFVYRNFVKVKANHFQQEDVTLGKWVDTDI